MLRQGTRFLRVIYKRKAAKTLENLLKMISPGEESYKKKSHKYHKKKTAEC